MFSKILVRTLAVAGLAVACIGTAKAQQGCRSIVLPNGTVLTCQVVNGQKVYVDSLGNSYNASSSGTGSFTVVNSSTNPCTAILNPAGINVTSTDPVLGVVSTTLDASRPATPSRISSFAVNQEFPAHEDIYFYARATVSSIPGNFRSIQQIHLNSNNVRSFNPHVNEPFNLVNAVDFEDINHPGKVVFTLRTLNVVLTAPGRQ